MIQIGTVFVGGRLTMFKDSQHRLRRLAHRGVLCAAHPSTGRQHQVNSCFDAFVAGIQISGTTCTARVARVELGRTSSLLARCRCHTSCIEYLPCLTSGRCPHYWMVMKSNPLTSLSIKDLERAVAIREQIESLQNELARIIGAQAAPAENGAPRRKKRRMSAAARARISAAMKARWAQKARK